MGEIRMLDKEGDVKEAWDSSKPDEVKHARETYEKFTKQKYMAFRVKKGGEKGEKLDKFDPDAELIILSPPLVGG